MRQLKSLAEINRVLEGEPLVLLIIKTGQCGVCESVEVKVSLMLESRPNVTGIYAYMEDAPDTASAFLALSAPTVILFFQGKEVYRIARFVRFDELDRVLTQYEEMLRVP
ncbi:thioredoxin family protein [Paenibacillus sp. DMB20]|uniref:thioredoxin family protein n=1 Tax=Paenibacillus sp. DMB20 TaxID=1642570 RepID=UPI0006275EBA|nr:thioredoxin family protein [Paenibacillus sp. DMB20]KKO54194.1 thioredoxin [Paenibacillus sp. DMB20]